MDLKARARKFLMSSTENLRIARSDGSYVFNGRGRRYVDFMMGWCVGNVGWGRNELRKAVHSFKGPDYVMPGYLYEPWVELGELLARITPGNLQKCFRATGGTEAVEIALQVAMAATGRSGFLSIEGSYHGNSLGTMSVGASEYREQYGNLLSHCHKIKPPLDEAKVDQVERLLKKKDIAAFIMEPIILNLGVLIPEVQFMKRIQGLCKQYGTLLIMDEVATGFGRTGKMFASEHFNLQPDVLCLAKAITGGSAGLGAVIVTNTVALRVKGKVDPYSTYGWHPLGVAVAIANIRYLLQHKTPFLNHVNDLSVYFKKRLSRISFKQSTEIRIKGLAIGIELSRADDAEKIKTRASKAGLLIGAEDKTIKMFPALTLDHKTAKEGLDLFEEVCN